VLKTEFDKNHLSPGWRVTLAVAQPIRTRRQIGINLGLSASTVRVPIFRIAKNGRVAQRPD
jgi:hypothetical protein